MCDDGTLVHRDEVKAVVNGFTDGEKKSYCFENSCLRRVFENQESELHLNSIKKCNDSNNTKIKRYQLRMKGGKMHVNI